MRRFCSATILRLLLAGTVGLAMAPIAPLHADSWVMPEQTVYHAADKSCRVTVTPRPIGSQLRYFERKVAESEGKAQPQPGFAQAKAECKDQKGRWQQVWSNPISNEVAPVEVLVSNGAKRVVTFDNWHQVGYGDNVVVIYDETGQVLGRYALDQLVTAEYIAAMPHSVSSIRWRGAPRIDEQANRLIVPLMVPGIDPSDEKTDYIELTFSLDTGRFNPPAGTRWDKAQADAKAANTAMARAEEANRLYLINPLFGPATNDERNWHGYLQEAYARVTPSNDIWAYASITVLRDPQASDYKVSEKWVNEAIADLTEVPGEDASFATTGPPDNLVRVLGKALGKQKQGNLKGSTLYVAIPSSYRDELARIIAPTGATFVWLDPATGIPQRPERIPGSPEQAAAQERMRKDVSDDAMGAARAAAKMADEASKK